MAVNTKYARERGSHKIWSVAEGPRGDCETVLLTLTMADGRKISQAIPKAQFDTLYVPVYIDYRGRWVTA